MTRKELILSQAAKLFRRKGFSATSMRDIAKEVGIEAPSLYNHIKSKDEILSEILLDIAEDFTQGMNAIIQTYSDPKVMIQEIIKLHLTLTQSKTNQIALITNEWKHLPQIAKESFIQSRNSYEKNMRHVLSEGMDQGVFKNVNKDLALFSILSTLRWFYAWYGANPEVNKEKIEKEMYTVLVEGILSS